ncbi:MAG: cation:proton antiporter [Phycisphaerae bacterium]|nr:cation:proton antiporter [Phycisphaerae bacterium]
MATIPLGVIETGHLSILLLLGFALFGGSMGARLFQKMRIPQVVGYIAIGLLIGESGFKLIASADVENFRQFNYFALGIIGFLVGGELKGAIFKKYGKQFMAILLGEGLGAFLLVGISTGLFLYFLIDNPTIALAGGIVFGAIASATDPASTIDVLWEYRSKGVLTTGLVAIVALDDALAMTLYGLGTAAAGMLMGGSDSFAVAIGKVCIELFGAIGVGAAAGLILNFIIRHLHQPDKTLTVAIGSILIVIAASVIWEMDVILATMTMGVVLINIAPRRSKDLFKIVRSFSPPIYVIFFVLVGARLGIGSMPGWMWGIVGLYVFFRTLGKMVGTYVGAKITKAPAVIQKYAGMGLFAQGGVAVGLSIMAGQHLGDYEVTGGMMLGDMIIFGVTATTLIVQILGPPMVKLAIRLAGESGMNITREDLLKSYSVADIMVADPATLSEGDSFHKIMQTLSTTDAMTYPVVDENKTLLGIITVEGLKTSLGQQSLSQLLVAYDLMQSPPDTASPDMPLETAMTLMREQNLEYLTVTSPSQDGDGKQLEGLLEYRRVERKLDHELLRRQEAASDCEQSMLLKAAIQKHRKNTGLTSEK